MLQQIKQGIGRVIAGYDAWCQHMGLTAENRRSCAPVRYDLHDPRHPSYSQCGKRDGVGDGCKQSSPSVKGNQHAD